MDSQDDLALVSCDGVFRVKLTGEYGSDKETCDHHCLHRRSACFLRQAVSGRRMIARRRHSNKSNHNSSLTARMIRALIGSDGTALFVPISATVLPPMRCDWRRRVPFLELIVDDKHNWADDRSALSALSCTCYRFRYIGSAGKSRTYLPGLEAAWFSSDRHMGFLCTANVGQAVLICRQRFLHVLFHHRYGDLVVCRFERL